MRYCKKCVQPDTRPGIKFNEDGVCPACVFADTPQKIDWLARRQELEKIADFARQRNVSGYDCIIGVSGGKDSMRQAFYVRDELKLKPLLVSCTYPPEQQTERGAYNIANLVSHGFDCISVSPNPQVWKILMREGFLRFGNWCKSTETALYASAPLVSIAYHIPLIFLGENPAIALGDLDIGSTTGDGNRMKYCHTMKGGPDVLLVEEIGEKDLFMYRYPSDDEMEWTQMRIVYLGYFMSDFTRFKNAEFGVAHGLQIRSDPPEDIGDNYGFEALDDDFVVQNQMFKYLKFGFGKVTDQVSEAIRLGMMTRAEAIELVKAYDGKCAKRFIDRFCNYLGITDQQFWEVAERFRNQDVWQKNSRGEWELKEKLV
jgi:N-acetyl sugar amidotransferase